MRPFRGIDRRDGEGAFNASPARIVMHGLIALVMQALAQAIRCRCDNGASSGTADRLHATVIPARGGDGAHIARALMGSQGAMLPVVVQGAKTVPRSNRRTVGQGSRGAGRRFLS